jgi:phosphatidate cytidylyltransferase
VLSAIVLAPPVALAIYAGSPFAELLIALALAQMAREWASVCGEGDRSPAAIALGAGALIATAVGRSAALGGGLAAAVLAAAALFLAARSRGWTNPAWLAAGVLVLAVPGLSFLWLRFDSPAGRELVLWLFLAVWATDIGAYAFGRGIGGPRLWPQVSPRKTWAGLAGGLLSAAAVSLASAWWIGLGPHWAAAAAGVVLGALAQAGDLAESAVKRHFGVKDSGALIPGHGGLLDRIDGLIPTVPAVAVLTWLCNGGLTDWR